VLSAAVYANDHGLAVFGQNHAAAMAFGGVESNF
jgi:hypothetical protein